MMVYIILTVMHLHLLLLHVPHRQMSYYYSIAGLVICRVLLRIFSSLFSSCSQDKLVCDACELAKHTRATYPSKSERSKTPFEVVHSDVWGPSATTSISGHRWFVTFVDGFSRCT
uniref:GAG-pre-integrase domain-containing protein n=1 Tax=Arundo donax TaxID=35708 RepID=A0A0A8ZIM7_ARUDO